MLRGPNEWLIGLALVVAITTMIWCAVRSFDCWQRGLMPVRGMFFQVACVKGSE